MKKVVIIVGGLSLIVGISTALALVLKEQATNTFDIPMPDLYDVPADYFDEPREENKVVEYDKCGDETRTSNPHTKVKPMETGFSMNPP